MTVREPVGVVIVHYRTPELLVHCLRSLRFQRVPIHVVVVDTSEQPIVRMQWGYLAVDLPSVCLIERPDNPGFGTACNIGVAALPTETDWLIIANADIVFLPNTLRMLHRFLETHSRAGLVGPRIEAPDGHIEPSWGAPITLMREWVYRWRMRWMRWRVLQRRWQQWTTPRRVGWVSGACMAMRWAAWTAVRGFDPGFFLYYEDCDLGIRVQQAGWEVWWTPTATVVHTRGASVQENPGIRARVRRDRRNSQMRYYRKHRPRWEQTVLRWYHRWWVRM